MRRAAITGVAFWLILTPQLFAATFVTAELGLGAEADAGGGRVEDDDNAIQDASLQPLSVSVEAIAVFNGGESRAAGKGTATWIDASRGSFEFTELGFKITDGELGSMARMDQGVGWSYTFQATEDGVFELAYDTSFVDGTTSSFGLSFDFFFNGGVFIELPIPGVGVLSQPILAGETYTARIRAGGNIFPTGSGVNLERFQEGSFDFVIKAVPEPSGVVLALFALCLGLAKIRR